jgi:ABC transport system ATP-binding/permease protein
MSLFLKIIKGNNVGNKFEIEEGKEYEFRRLPLYEIPDDISRKTTFFLDDQEISKKHAKVILIGKELIVEDFNSTNGVYLNGKRIEKSIAKVGDKLKLGKTFFSVEDINDVEDINESNSYSKPTKDFKNLVDILDEKIIFNPSFEDIEEYNLNNYILSYMQKIKKEVLSKNIDDKAINTKETLESYFFKINLMDLEKEVMFYRKKIIIGRVGDLIINDKSLSKEHAEVTVLPSLRFKIKDLGSQNGTFINNSKVTTAVFKENDTIKLGDTRLKFSYIKEDF